LKQIYKNFGGENKLLKTILNKNDLIAEEKEQFI